VQRSLCHLDLPITHPHNEVARTHVLGVYRCPSDVGTDIWTLEKEDDQGPRVRLAASNYVGVFGTFDIEDAPASGEGVFFHHSAIRFADVTRARIRVYHFNPDVDVPVTCVLCDDAPCVASCPVAPDQQGRRAIYRDPVTRVIPPYRLLHDHAWTISYANMGGFLAPEIRFAGYGGIMIRGRADRPVYLYIDGPEVQIRDARKYWGIATDRFDRVFHEDLGEPRFQSCYIGPAGENLVSFACILNTAVRAAGRGGTGCVMGSKNLKAIDREASVITLLREGERKDACKCCLLHLDAVSVATDRRRPTSGKAKESCGCGAPCVTGAARSAAPPVRK
jgi:hypothetical protein